jgi:apolipoprotein D and lipocalin family protein
MPRAWHLVLAMCAAVLPGSMHAAETKPLSTVPKVDLARYLGTWYEIAAIPQWFQRDCVATTATYSKREDGDIAVLNQCRVKTLDGKPKQARARAWVVDPQTNAKLKVQFFWPFRGSYWIIELDPDYRYAVVGHPSRNYLWILSRTPRMDDALYRDLMQRIERHGYDTTRIVRTLQSDG